MLVTLFTGILYTCSLPFLDTLIIKNQDDETIRKKIYRKKTHTGRYLNLKSYHRMSHKISAIDALAFRAFVNCDEEFLQEELNIIKQDFISNGYPSTLIQKRFQRMKVRADNWKPGDKLAQPTDTDNPKPRLILPYCGPLTSRLTTYLREELECEFAYTPGRKIGSFLCKLKGSIPKKEIGGIYAIPVRERTTNSFIAWYIGETSKPLQMRLNQNKKDVKNKKTTSALVNHLINNKDHYIHFDSATLIENKPRYFHRKFKEHLYIVKNVTINQNRGFNISAIWDGSLPLMMVQLTPPNYNLQ